MTGLTLESLQILGLTAVVASPRMHHLMELTRRVARSTATVLVTGESGSGKEVIARALHHYSLRCTKPWVDVSCGALPEHLMESELFGYERGAFSGADAAKPGLLNLNVPPLRDRPEDILPLARYFLEVQDPALVLDPRAEKALESYAWPGNVREVRNLMTRAAIMARDGIVVTSDLNLPIEANATNLSANNTLDGVEKQTILRVLDEMHGHRQRTAARLGISRRTLTRKLKVYGLTGNESVAAPAAEVA